MTVFNQFLTTPVGSALRVFAGVVLAALVKALAGGQSLGQAFNSWQDWVEAGLIVAIPILIAAVNPEDKRWGAGNE